MHFLQTAKDLAATPNERTSVRGEPASRKNLLVVL